MAVLLDSKDLAAVDQEFAVESKVWSVLAQGAKDITEADFVGVNEVRVNVMTGFEQKAYTRNGTNGRSKINVTKQTRKLEKEIWMGYDLDTLDQSENGSYNIDTLVETHTRQVAIPEKDVTAVLRLLQNSGKLVEEDATTANSLQLFDVAEQYMTDTEVTGPFVMFVSSDYYRKLKGNEQVSKTFTTNEVNLAGIDRRVGMLDNAIPIIEVPKDRLQVDEAKQINFILVPLQIAAPIEKFSDVTLVPRSQDRDGYRDTIKGLNYYDLIVFDNAKKGIYVSYSEVVPEA